MFERLWNFVKKVARATFGTGGLGVISYVAGKAMKNSKYDFLHVADAFEKTGKEQQDAMTGLTTRALASIGLGTAASYLFDPAPPANLPANAQKDSDIYRT